jgi:hypothetical protein
MTTMSEAAKPHRPSKAVAAAGRWFYLAVGLAMACAVAFGFSQTIDAGLFRPKIPRPAILYLHATVMTAWLALFVTQAGLARARLLSWHRTLGVAGLCLGVAIPLVGVPTAIIMRRFDIDHLGAHLPFIAVPLGDMVTFTGFFALGALWRKRPEFHRRLMFLATVSLIDAGLGRFPVPDAWFDAGWFDWVIDALVLLAVGRDLLLTRRIHPVFAYGLPALILCQAVVFWLWHAPPAPWLALMRTLVGAG